MLFNCLFNILIIYLKNFNTMKLFQTKYPKKKACELQAFNF